MTTDTLRAQLREVAERRAIRDDIATAVTAARAAFEASIAAQVQALAQAKADADASETAARALIVAIYEVTGDKKPAEGAGVQVRTKLEYDEAQALAWAREHRMAIVPEKLDAPAFAKIAKASPDSFPFVRVVEEPIATLGGDLSAYLAAPAPVLPPVTTEAPF